MNNVVEMAGIAITLLLAFSGVVAYVVRLASRVNALEDQMKTSNEALAAHEHEATRREERRDARCQIDSTTLTQLLQRMTRIETLTDTILAHVDGSERGEK